MVMTVNHSQSCLSTLLNHVSIGFDTLAFHLMKPLLTDGDDQMVKPKVPNNSTHLTE